jgi:hypothetical protein
MLGVGLDWAEAFHVVAIGRPETGVTEVCRIEHTPAGLAGLIDHLRRLEPTPERVRVVLETRHGLLVEALLAAGFTVVPVNPDLVARRRGPARKKDDVEDARICWLLAIDPHTQLKPLVAHSPVAAELRSIARDDARLAQDERRLLNRLRADLLATFPAALPSPATSSARQPSCACSSPGRPAGRWAPCQVPSWPTSPAAASTATPSGSPPRSWMPSPPSTWPCATNWPGPRPTPSG